MAKQKNPEQPSAQDIDGDKRDQGVDAGVAKPGLLRGMTNLRDRLINKHGAEDPRVLRGSKTPPPKPTSSSRS